MRLTRAERWIRILGGVAAAVLVGLVVSAWAVDYEPARNVTTIVGGLQTGTTTTKTAQFSAAGNLLVASPAGASADQVQGTAADGAAPVGNPVQIGGSDGAAMQVLLTDTGGRLAVNPIAGQAGVAAGSGVNGATVQRVTIATDDETNDDLDTLAGTVTAARLATNPIAGQAGVQGGAGASSALTQRVALATDANAVQQGAGAGAASPWAVRVTNDGAAFATVATDRTTAAAPFAVRVTDGTGFGTLGLSLGSEVGVNRITPVASTGATAATLLAATATQVIYPTTLVTTNESATTDYTVELLSSTGPVVLLRYYLPAKSTLMLDLRGDVRTDASDALQYRLTAAGTDVRVSGSAIKR